MSTKKLLYFLHTLFFFSFCSSLHAQTVTISGTVQEIKKRPVAYAEIALLINDSTVIQNGLTDSLGVFSLVAPPGSYRLHVNQFGTLLLNKDLLIAKSIDLGLLVVRNTKEMRGVMIQGRKRLIERKVDRLVFNVGNSIAASGGDALDALKIAPGVSVNNDAISIIGKSDMMVMVDGRMLQMKGADLINYLKTIRADDIKSIEIITNPPAQYSAEGNAGIINIKLREAKADSWSAVVRGVYHQATYATGALNGTLNYQKKKFSLTANLGYAKGSIAPTESSKIFYPNQTWDEINSRRDFSNTLSGRLSAEYKLNSKISVGIKYDHVSTQPEIDDDIQTNLSNPNSGKQDSILSTRGVGKIKNTTHLLNAHIIYDIDTTGKKLSVDLDYLNLNSNTNRVFKTNSDSYVLANANTLGDQQINNYSLNIDMEHPLKWIKINYGGRVSATKTNNIYTYYDLRSGEPVMNPGLSNEFIFNENLQALYVSGNKKLNDKWEAQAGLRFEATQIKGNSVTTDVINRLEYKKLFPTFYISYVPNQNHSFSFNYGKRINRPNFDILNPFKWVTSPYSYSEGNPKLLPSISNNFELGHTYKELLTTTLFVNLLKDGFNQIAIIDSSTNSQRIEYSNFISSYDIGISEFLNFKPLKFINTIFQATVFYSHSTSHIPVTLNQLSGWNGYFNLSNDVTLNKAKTLFANITYEYNAPGVANVNKVSSYSQFNATVKMLLLRKKLVLTLAGNDIFKSNRPEYTAYSNGIRTTFKNYYDGRYFRITLNYTLGGKLSSPEERSAKNQDEINRSNK